jgi:hypothetical protein
MAGDFGLTIDSSSITKLVLHFDEITPALQRQLKVAISRVTHQLLARVRAAEPVRTGRLRSLTRAYVDERPNFVRGRVRILGQRGPNQPARAFGALEYGGPGQRRTGKVRVRWSSRGNVGVTAYERRRPRRRARRFLRGPAAAMRPQIRAELEAALGQAIKEFDFGTLK